MPGEQGALDVRQHGLVEADDAGEPVLARAHPGEQVLSDLLLDGPVDVAARPELADGRPAGGAERLRLGWLRLLCCTLRHYVGRWTSSHPAEVTGVAAAERSSSPGGATLLA